MYTPTLAELPLPARVSPAAIQAIVANDARPIVRNLQVTQGYADLSQALGGLIGRENANWCTYATWASKTAGRFVRLEGINYLFRKALHEPTGFDQWVKLVHEKVADPNETPVFDGNLVHAAEGVLADVSGDIAAGNLEVFSELGPIFAAMIEAYSRPAGEWPPLGEFLASLKLKPGPSETGGQDVLRSALTHYHAAILEQDPKRKAELVMLANAQVGLHEQTRLQRYIAGSMEAPLKDLVTVVVKRGRLRGLIGLLRHAPIAVLVWRFVRHRVAEAWLRILTHYNMDLYLPDASGAIRPVHLGRALPSLPGEPLFPPELRTVDDPELRALLLKYGVDPAAERCLGAKEWNNLPDRMRYIIELFRSRQRDAHIMQAPFTPEQLTSIDAGELPRELKGL